MGSEQSTLTTLFDCGDDDDDVDDDGHDRVRDRRGIAADTKANTSAWTVFESSTIPSDDSSDATPRPSLPSDGVIAPSSSSPSSPSTSLAMAWDCSVTNVLDAMCCGIYSGGGASAAATTSPSSSHRAADARPLFSMARKTCGLCRIPGCGGVRSAHWYCDDGDGAIFEDVTGRSNIPALASDDGERAAAAVALAAAVVAQKKADEDTCAEAVEVHVDDHYDRIVVGAGDCAFSASPPPPTLLPFSPHSMEARRNALAARRRRARARRDEVCRLRARLAAVEAECPGLWKCRQAEEEAAARLWEGQVIRRRIAEARKGAAEESPEGATEMEAAAKAAAFEMGEEARVALVAAANVLAAATAAAAVTKEKYASRLDNGDRADDDTVRRVRRALGRVNRLLAMSVASANAAVADKVGRLPFNALQRLTRQEGSILPSALYVGTEGGGSSGHGVHDDDDDDDNNYDDDDDDDDDASFRTASAHRASFVSDPILAVFRRNAAACDDESTFRSARLALTEKSHCSRRGILRNRLSKNEFHLDNNKDCQSRCNSSIVGVDDDVTLRWGPSGRSDPSSGRHSAVDQDGTSGYDDDADADADADECSFRSARSDRSKSSKFSQSREERTVSVLGPASVGFEDDETSFKSARSWRSGVSRCSPSRESSVSAIPTSVAFEENDDDDEDDDTSFKSARSSRSGTSKCSRGREHGSASVVVVPAAVGFEDDGDDDDDDDNNTSFQSARSLRSEVTSNCRGREYGPTTSVTPASIGLENEDTSSRSTRSSRSWTSKCSQCREDGGIASMTPASVGFEDEDTLFESARSGVSTCSQGQGSETAQVIPASACFQDDDDDDASFKSTRSLRSGISKCSQGRENRSASVTDDDDASFKSTRSSRSGISRCSRSRENGSVSVTDDDASFKSARSSRSGISKCSQGRENGSASVTDDDDVSFKSTRSSRSGISKCSQGRENGSVSVTDDDDVSFKSTRSSRSGISKCSQGRENGSASVTDDDDVSFKSTRSLRSGISKCSQGRENGIVSVQSTPVGLEDDDTFFKSAQSARSSVSKRSRSHEAGTASVMPVSVGYQGDVSFKPTRSSRPGVSRRSLCRENGSSSLVSASIDSEGEYTSLMSVQLARSRAIKCSVSGEDGSASVVPASAGVDDDASIKSARSRVSRCSRGRGDGSASAVPVLVDLEDDDDDDDDDSFKPARSLRSGASRIIKQLNGVEGTKVASFKRCATVEDGNFLKSAEPEHFRGSRRDGKRLDAAEEMNGQSIAFQIIDNEVSLKSFMPEITQKGQHSRRRLDIAETMNGESIAFQSCVTLNDDLPVKSTMPERTKDRQWSLGRLESTKGSNTTTLRVCLSFDDAVSLETPRPDPSRSSRLQIPGAALADDSVAFKSLEDDVSFKSAQSNLSRWSQSRLRQRLGTPESSLATNESSRVSFADARSKQCRSCVGFEDDDVSFKSPRSDRSRVSAGCRRRLETADSSLATNESPCVAQVSGQLAEFQSCFSFEDDASFKSTRSLHSRNSSCGQSDRRRRLGTGRFSLSKTDTLSSNNVDGLSDDLANGIGSDDVVSFRTARSDHLGVSFAVANESGLDIVPDPFDSASFASAASFMSALSRRSAARSALMDSCASFRSAVANESVFRCTAADSGSRPVIRNDVVEDRKEGGGDDEDKRQQRASGESCCGAGGGAFVSQDEDEDLASRKAAVVAQLEVFLRSPAPSVAETSLSEAPSPNLWTSRAVKTVSMEVLNGGGRKELTATTMKLITPQLRTRSPMIRKEMLMPRPSLHELGRVQDLLLPAMSKDDGHDQIRNDCNLSLGENHCR